MALPNLFPPDLTADEVIAILRADGYVVVAPEDKRWRRGMLDRIVEVGAEHVIDDHMQQMVTAEQRRAMDDMIQRDSAMHMGLYMLNRGAITITREYNEVLMQEMFRFRARVVLPEGAR